MHTHTHFRFERRVGVIEKKLHRTVFLALKNYKRLELKLMWYEDKLATEVNRKVIRDIREKVRQATKHVDLAVHMTDLREGAKRLWFRSNRGKETATMPLPLDCDLEEVEELDISAGPPPLADLTVEDDMYTPLLPPPPLWNANERLRRDLMIQPLDMEALGSQCYELPPHLLAIYFPGVPADVVVSTCVEVVHFFKFFRGQLRKDATDDPDAGNKDKEGIVDMLKASLAVDAAPPPLTFRGFVEFVAKLNPGPTQHGSPIRQVLGDDDAADDADAADDSVARVAPSFDRVMTRLLRLLLVSSDGAEEAINLMNWPEVLRRYIRCRYLSFIHLTHNNTPLPTSNTIESDDSSFLGELTISHLLSLSAQPIKLANGPIVKPTQEAATAEAVKQHRKRLFTDGQQLLSNLEGIMKHELWSDEQKSVPSGTPGKTKESVAPQQVFIVTHKDALCLFGVGDSCSEYINGDDGALPYAHLATSRLLRQSGKRLDEFKSPLRSALGWIHHMGGVEGKGNNASSVVRRVLQTVRESTQDMFMYRI